MEKNYYIFCKYLYIILTYKGNVSLGVCICWVVSFDLFKACLFVKSFKVFYWISAAHTIGTTACFFMTKRLYNFTPAGGSDPDINPQLLPELKSRCPQDGDVNNRLWIDWEGDRVFDSMILQNIRDGFAVLESDARLYDDDATKRVIDSYFSLLSPIIGPSFESDFVKSIVKMGHINVKTGSLGEIRRTCSNFNWIKDTFVEFLTRYQQFSFSLYVFLFSFCRWAGLS